MSCRIVRACNCCCYVFAYTIVVFESMMFNDCSHAVFEQFEQDVMQVVRNEIDHFSLVADHIHYTNRGTTWSRQGRGRKIK